LFYNDYVKNKNIFYCPSSTFYADNLKWLVADRKESNATLAPTYIDYWYVGNFNFGGSSTGNLARTIGPRGPSRGWGVISGYSATPPANKPSLDPLVVDNVSAQGNSMVYLTLGNHTTSGKYVVYGGNTCFVDGHLEWKGIRNMNVRERYSATLYSCW
jgi:hypothetical protein